MYLRPLKTEQKKLFLELAKMAASANMVLEKSEKRLLAAYADEMGISTTDTSGLPLDALCRKLKEISSPKELNQMTFEIVGMMLSDSRFDADEQAFLSKVASTFGISEKTIGEMEQCVNDYAVLIERIDRLMETAENFV